MVGGEVIDVVPVSPDKTWVNTAASFTLRAGGTRDETCAVYCNPQGETIEPGDRLWWQSGWCFWTPRDESRADVKLPKIGYSGVSHPDEICDECGAPFRRCQCR